MKTLAVLFIFLITSVVEIHAQVVQVIMDKIHLTGKEEIKFLVRCASEQDLEITVFTEECLVSTQKAILTVGDHPFDFVNPDCPAGKYIVLVTGNGLHAEQMFFVKEE